jgi:predicted RNA binding protein YcfA (HicA-like mRNA interferase family)
MPRLDPISHTDLILRLRRLGFRGPFAGGKHQYMSKEDVRLILPNPHHSDIGKGLLARILREAGIDREDWEKL